MLYIKSYARSSLLAIITLIILIVVLVLVLVLVLLLLVVVIIAVVAVVMVVVVIVEGVIRLVSICCFYQYIRNHISTTNVIHVINMFNIINATISIFVHTAINELLGMQLYTDINMPSSAAAVVVAVAVVVMLLVEYVRMHHSA